MNRRTAINGAKLVLACLLLAITGFAQSDNANVSGVVTDPSGSAIPKAKVMLKNQATGLPREAFTTKPARIRFRPFPPGCTR